MTQVDQLFSNNDIIRSENSITFRATSNRHVDFGCVRPAPAVSLEDIIQQSRPYQDALHRPTASELSTMDGRTYYFRNDKGDKTEDQGEFVAGSVLEEGLEDTDSRLLGAPWGLLQAIVEAYNGMLVQLENSEQ